MSANIEINLENLLNLALGTPEIGSVNFNYLHEVITEILRHLGISKKTSRINHEVDYRLLEAKRSYVKKNHSIESVAETPEQTAITSPLLVEGEATIQDTSEAPQTEYRETTERTNDVKHVEPENSKGTKQNEAEIKDVKSQVGPLPPTQRKSSIVQRRSSMGKRLSMKESGNQDIALVNRKMSERRDSKTPAGDMWHVLNINRRVEAVEAAIQGMTNLVDTINAELEEMRNAPEAISTDISEPSSVPDGSSLSKQQELLKKMATKMKSCDTKIHDLEQHFESYAKKDELVGFCDLYQVDEMIKEQLSQFKPDVELSKTAEPHPPPVSHSSPVPVTAATAAAPPAPSAASVEPVAPKQPKPKRSVAEVPAQKKSSVALKKSTSSKSKANISNKMMHLEQEIDMAKNKLSQLEREVNKKIEALSSKQDDDKDDGKIARDEIVSEIKGLKGEIKALSKRISTLEEFHSSTKNEIQSLTQQNDEFATQQKKLSNSLRKLEQNLEDMTDNFHRTTSSIFRTQQPESVVDEAAMNKLRSGIYDLQEQQSKFQNDIDVLTKDSENKTKRLEEIDASVLDLQKTKVDEEYVKSHLKNKADKSSVENKVGRDQFDICISEIDNNMQDIMQKFDGSKSSTEKAVDNLQKLVECKVERDEISKMKGYIDTRFKTFKPKVSVTQQADDVTAVATRKKLLPGCNCISCDRPVDIPTTHSGLVLPCYQPLPGMKSIRPVTTFDLQTIRQHMQQSLSYGNKQRFEIAESRDKLQKELLQLCGARDLDELAAQTNRACGGIHTMVERRNPGKPAMFYREEEHAPFQVGERQLFETDVLGRDGHIYKGRLQSPALPQIPTKSVEQPLLDDSPMIPRPSVQKSGSSTPKAQAV